MGHEMIELAKLKELVQLMVENDLAELDIRDGEESVTLTRAAALQALQAHAPAPIAAPALAASAPTPAPAAESAAAPAEGDPNLAKIESPMVGTFYNAQNPDSPPFVSVGQKVSADTVVCLIEAMKVFTEVKAERSGVIDSVLVESGDAVEFGQALFSVRPA